MHLGDNEADNGPPYDHTKFAQCDYIATNLDNRYNCNNIYNDINLGLSDHFPSIAEICL